MRGNITPFQKPKSKGGNLVEPWTKEKAKEMNLKSQESRKANKAMRMEVSAFVKSLGDVKDAALGVPDPIDVLKLLLAKAIMDGDDIKQFEYAKELAPYSTPKLAAQSLTVEQINAQEMTDEELAVAVQELEDKDEVQRVHVPSGHKEAGKDKASKKRPQKGQTAH